MGSCSITNGSKLGTPRFGIPFTNSGIASWVALTKQSLVVALQGWM